MHLRLGRAIAKIWRGHLTTLPENLHTMKLTVNGAELEVDDRHAKTPLLWVLRDVLAMHRTKFVCGIGYCAACTVLIDCRNTKSCQTRPERSVGNSLLTTDGPSGPRLSP